MELMKEKDVLISEMSQLLYRKIQKYRSGLLPIVQDVNLPYTDWFLYGTMKISYPYVSHAIMFVTNCVVCLIQNPF